MPTPAPKITSNGFGFGPLANLTKEAEAEVGQAVEQVLYGSWRAYVTALGQTVPANVTRAKHAIRNIKGSTR